jgi:gliding motility-associated-like protein
MFHIPCISPNDDHVVLCVYNRWGIEVYRNEHYSNASGWDGMYKGAPLPDGTYYYILKYTNDKAEAINRAGYITLRR